MREFLNSSGSLARTNDRESFSPWNNSQVKNPLYLKIFWEGMLGHLPEKAKTEIILIFNVCSN